MGQHAASSVLTLLKHARITIYRGTLPWNWEWSRWTAIIAICEILDILMPKHLGGRSWSVGGPPMGSWYAQANETRDASQAGTHHGA